MKGKRIRKNEKIPSASSKLPPNRPMPTDPKDLARAMFGK